MENNNLKQPLFQTAPSYILNFNVDELEICLKKKKGKKVCIFVIIEKTSGLSEGSAGI